MQLVWNLHPKQMNVQQANSAAYQYRLQEWNDGRTELTVQHRGDRPSETPIKRFVYKNRNGAFGGAQRFEDKHGYLADQVDRINRLCAVAWDEGFNAGTTADPMTDEWSGPVKYVGALNPYRKAETTEE